MAQDIVWDFRPPLDDPKRQKFHTAFNELLTEKGITYRQLAEALFGKRKDGLPNNLTVVRDWSHGQKFPQPKSAKDIAKYFKVPLVRLLTPKGALLATHVKQAVKQKGPPPPPPPLELPKGAPPLTFSLKDFKKDPRFAEVTISGVCEIDVAMAVFALVHRK